MNQMGFNVLRRAQDDTKSKDGLAMFFSEKGIDLKEVQQNPEYYEDLIMEYSRQCINLELFKQSREHMEHEFNRLCEFHRRNEDELVKQFFQITNDIICNEIKRKKIGQ